jgi:hypothetical protein
MATSGARIGFSRALEAWNCKTVVEDTMHVSCDTCEVAVVQNTDSRTGNVV